MMPQVLKGVWFIWYNLWYVTSQTVFKTSAYRGTITHKCMFTNVEITYITGSSVSSVQFSHLVVSDPMDCSTPDFPIRHQLPELTQTHVHGVGDALQPSHPLLSPSPPTFGHSQQQYLNSQQYAVDILWCVSGVSHMALMVKNPPANAGDIRDMGSIPGSGRSPGGGNGNPRQLFLPGKFHGQKNLEDYSP